MSDELSADVREYARNVAASLPPLTPDQQLRLAVLLRPDMPLGIAPAAEPSKRRTTRRRGAA